MAAKMPPATAATSETATPASSTRRRRFVRRTRRVSFSERKDRDRARTAGQPARGLRHRGRRGVTNRHVARFQEEQREDEQGPAPTAGQREPGEHRQREDGHERMSVPLTDEELSSADAVVIVTDHSSIDYQRVVNLAALLVDTRNATAGLKRAGLAIA